MTKKKDSTNKWGFSELILILLIFSPYVFTSIRLDHLMIVILMVILLFQKLHKGAAISVVFLVSYYIIVLISTGIELISGQQLATYSQILDSFEWYLRGAILFLFFASQKFTSEDTLHNLIIIYIVSALIIGTIALLQIIFGEVVNNFIGNLYSPNHLGGVTFDSMMSNRRYSSILYQPVSYGLYFLYAISLVILYSNFYGKHRFTRYLLILILLPLSILSISKAIFLGIPILMVFLLIRNKITLFLIFFSTIFIYLVALITFPISILESYDGAHIVNIAKDPSYIFAVLDTALDSRFSDEGALSGDLYTVSQHLLLGVGWSEVYARMGDSGYVPIMVRGGIAGLIVYLIYILTVFYQSYKATCRDPALFKFKNLYLFFIVTSLLLATGSPVLYIDRVADFYWMFSGVLLATYRNNLTSKKYLHQEDDSTVQK
jgi:hypothetical protein